MRWRIDKLIIAMICTITACSTTHRPAVVEDRAPPPEVARGMHEVQAGDTLYGLAWYYGREVHELAQINGLQPPYKLYPQQKIALSAQDKAVLSPRQGSTLYRNNARQIEQNSKVVTAAVNRSAVSGAAAAGFQNRWVLPTQGTLLSKFNKKSSSNGVDIGGQLGQQIVAANGGEVVYAGSGLRGYGKLVIIKHNEEWLSAYGHNSKLYVQEGQQVALGEQIAAMGRSSDRNSDQAKLHFEIRKRGQPLDPMLLISKKS